MRDRGAVAAVTHFVTLHYLALFAPWLALLMGASAGAPRLALVVAAGCALFGLTRLPEELFSRQLACDALSLTAVVAIALLAWRAPTRRTLLAAFALAVVASGNDLVSLMLAATLANVCLASRAALPWALLAGATAFVLTGETELAIVAPHPAAAIVLVLGCVLALPRQALSLPAACALLIRLAGLWLAAPGSRWLLQ